MGVDAVLLGVAVGHRHGCGDVGVAAGGGVGGGVLGGDGRGSGEGWSGAVGVAGGVVRVSVRE